MGAGDGLGEVISEEGGRARGHSSSCSACSERRAPRAAAAPATCRPGRQCHAAEPGVCFHRARWGLEEEDFQPREVGIAKTFSEPVI